MGSKSSVRVAGLSPRDRQVLAFIAEHQVVVGRQVEILTGGSRAAVRGRLLRLEREGFVRHDDRVGGGCWLIRRAGLGAVGCRLAAPQLKLGSYEHSVGLAWLWLAAWGGAFGPVSEVIGERRMRSHDGAAISAEELYSVRLGGYAADGHECRHYPDVLLVDPHGRRLALELELSAKRVTARRQILGGYGSDRRLDGVLYLVENNLAGRSIARGIHATAAEMDLLDRVQVRRVSPILSTRVEVRQSAAGGASRAGAPRPPGAAGSSSTTRAAAEAGR